MNMPFIPSLGGACNAMIGRSVLHRCSRRSAAIHTGRFALRRAEAARVLVAMEAA
jgi:hypothetical protein